MGDRLVAFMRRPSEQMTPSKRPPADEFSELVHDLKTPLAMIVGYAELLQTRPDDEEIRREAPALIIEAAERLGRTLDEALALFSPE